jgi:putative transcriptional regulator
MSVADATKPKSEEPARRTSDWSRLDAMSEVEKHAAALGDPDAMPLTEADMDRMRRTPRARIVRRALGLSQEAFADRYRIPIGTLRDWEQGRSEPDQAARAYLTVIARAPDMGAKRSMRGRKARTPDSLPCRPRWRWQLEPTTPPAPRVPRPTSLR